MKRRTKESSPSPQPSPSEEGESTRAVCRTKTQMAAALQVSVRTLKGMMSRGEISYFRIGSRLVRFRVEEALKRMGETVLVAAEGDDH